jgi:hypothetical protein
MLSTLSLDAHVEQGATHAPLAELDVRALREQILEGYRAGNPELSTGNKLSDWAIVYFGEKYQHMREAALDLRNALWARHGELVLYQEHWAEHRVGRSVELDENGIKRFVGTIAPDCLRVQKNPFERKLTEPIPEEIRRTPEGALQRIRQLDEERDAEIAAAHPLFLHLALDGLVYFESRTGFREVTGQSFREGNLPILYHELFPATEEMHGFTLHPHRRSFQPGSKDAYLTRSRMVIGTVPVLDYLREQGILARDALVATPEDIYRSLRVEKTRSDELREWAKNPDFLRDMER